MIYTKYIIVIVMYTECHWFLIPWDAENPPRLHGLIEHAADMWDEHHNIQRRNDYLLTW